MFIQRKLQKIVENDLGKGKVIIIYGPRQVGKTTLVREVLKNYQGKAEYYSCEEGDVVEALSRNTSAGIKQFFGDRDLIILDEAQKIKDIGTKLKLLIDNYPQTQLLVTGSSSFELANQTKEPLTGRKFEYFLFPLSVWELQETFSNTELKRMLRSFLTFGSYPEIVPLPETEAKKRLKEISGSYLYKDIFSFQEIKNPEVLSKLVKLLALQTGQEVSFSELANKLDVNIQTIERYIRLLEEAFVIFRLPALSRNQRKEVSKTRKIYFYDLGVRNSLIDNFNNLDLRLDTGNLFENFVILERMKYLEYAQLYRSRYFWRTYSQKEIDYIEEYDGKLKGYEIKWNQNRKVKPPKLFLESYPNSTFEIVSPDNWLDFVSG
jgi:uncharacterized protein